MKQIKVLNTYQLYPKGKPSKQVVIQGKSTHLAVLPSSIPHIKPKLTKKVNERVKKGEKIFFDKQNDQIFFCSPAGGTIKEIIYGPRRRLDEVIIEIDKEEESIDFKKWNQESIDSITKEDLISELTERGLWPAFRQFPFNNIPKQQTTPPSIYVSLDQDEPYMPQADVILKDKLEDLEIGINLLKKLTQKVVVAVHENSPVKNQVQQIATHEIKGDYPAMNPGVVLYYEKKSADENKAWKIHVQQLLRIVESLKTGAYPTEKTIVLAGDLAHKKTHIKTREGVSIEALCEGNPENEPTRYILGGVLTGKKSHRKGFVGFDDFALHQITEGSEQELLSFFKLGLQKHTKSKTYVSGLYDQSTFKFTTGLNGGHRSCIACGECVEVCPVGSLPQLLMKSVLANELEESLSHGLLDCVDCGLCTYVCPSKIEFDEIIGDQKNRLAKEALR